MLPLLTFFTLIVPGIVAFVTMFLDGTWRDSPNPRRTSYWSTMEPKRRSSIGAHAQTIL